MISYELFRKTRIIKENTNVNFVLQIMKNLGTWNQQDSFWLQESTTLHNSG